MSSLIKLSIVSSLSCAIITSSVFSSSSKIFLAVSFSIVTLPRPTISSLSPLVIFEIISSSGFSSSVTGMPPFRENTLCTFASSSYPSSSSSWLTKLPFTSSTSLISVTVFLYVAFIPLIPSKFSVKLLSTTTVSSTSDNLLLPSSPFSLASSSLLLAISESSSSSFWRCFSISFSFPSSFSFSRSSMSFNFLSTSSLSNLSCSRFCFSASSLSFLSCNSSTLYPLTGNKLLNNSPSLNL
mmetsp:Transcript_37681/g.56380  ORF Transcript_37681/g.56380 Transcript_37681/m.56380 type:complete len:240 (-) Transcript_37681:1392-2111(-)